MDEKQKILEQIALEYGAQESEKKFEQDNAIPTSPDTDVTDQLVIEDILKNATQYEVSVNFQDRPQLGEDYFSSLKEATNESMFLTRVLYEKSLSGESSVQAQWIKTRNFLLHHIFRRNDITNEDIIERLIENSRQIGGVLSMVIGHSLHVRDSIYTYYQEISGRVEQNSQEETIHLKKLSSIASTYLKKEEEVLEKKFGEGRGFTGILAIAAKKRLGQARMLASQYQSQKKYAKEEIGLMDHLTTSFDQSTNEAILAFRYIQNVTQTATKIYEVYIAMKQRNNLINLSKQQLKELTGYMLTAYQSANGFLGNVRLVYKQCTAMPDQKNIDFSEFIQHAKSYDIQESKTETVLRR